MEQNSLAIEYLLAVKATVKAAICSLLDITVHIYSKQSVKISMCIRVYPVLQGSYACVQLSR